MKDYMLQKAYTPASMFLEALVLIAVGILFYVNPEGTLNVVGPIFHILLYILAADGIIRFITKRNEQWSALIRSILFLGLAVLLTVKPELFSSSLSLIAAIWILISAAARYIFVYQLLHTKSSGWLWTLIQAILYTLFAVVILTDLTQGMIPVTGMLGLYCLVSGLFALIDAFRELLGTDIGGKRVKQRMRFKPPIFLTALIPMRFLKAMDDPDEQAEIEHWTRKETSLENAEPNLEIFLHLGKNIAYGFGHVDIAIDGWTYSYGNYDATRNKLGGAFSDGVFFKAEREAYVRFCLDYEKKQLICYGVVLSDEQKAAIHKSIDDVLDKSTHWDPDPEKNADQYKLTQEAEAEYFKVGAGPFKTYNVLTTNCVALANLISGSSGGVDLMNPQGIVTPGTYADFLDRQFRRKNSIVVSRTVYRS